MKKEHILLLVAAGGIVAAVLIMRSKPRVSTAATPQPPAKTGGTSKQDLVHDAFGLANSLVNLVHGSTGANGGGGGASADKGTSQSDTVAAYESNPLVQLFG